MSSIHLSGQEYSVSAGAKSFLTSYLERVKKYVELKKIGIEYSQDIEMRLAERLGVLAREASETDAVKIVNELGEPEDIFADVSKKEGISSAAETIRSELRNPLHRDSSKGILFGVAAGLGDRWGIDPLYIRLGFLILLFFYGIGGPLYVALAILMKNQPSMKPAAQGSVTESSSSAQKMERDSGVSSNISDFFGTIGSIIRAIWTGFWSIAGKTITVIFLGVLGLVLLAKSFVLMMLSWLASSHTIIDNQQIFGAVDPILTASLGIAGLTLFVLGCVAILRIFNVKVGQAWMLAAAIVTLGVSILGTIFGGVNTASQYAHRATGETKEFLQTGSGEIRIDVDSTESGNLHLDFDASNIRFVNAIDGKASLTVRSTVSGRDAAGTDFILSKLKPVNITQSGGMVHVQSPLAQFSETVPFPFVTRELVFSIPAGTKVRIGNLPRRGNLENFEYSDLDTYGSGYGKCEWTTASYNSSTSRFRCDAAGYSADTVRAAKIEYLKSISEEDEEGYAYIYQRNVRAIDNGLYLVSYSDAHRRGGQIKPADRVYRVDISPEGKMSAVQVVNPPSPIMPSNDAAPEIER